MAPGYADEATPINPQRAAHEINKALPEEAILVSDIGVHHNWLLLFCKPCRPDSLIGCMGFGLMGFGVAGVLGAKLAAPDRPCVSVRRPQSGRRRGVGIARARPQPSADRRQVRAVMSGRSPASGGALTETPAVQPQPASACPCARRPPFDCTSSDEVVIMPSRAIQAAASRLSGSLPSRRL